MQLGRHFFARQISSLHRIQILVPPNATLQALNHHPDGAVKRQAEEWLKTFQESAHAWMVCDALLHDPLSTQEVHFLCSQTLKHKVQRDFDDLPAGAAGSLRDSLITLLLKFDEGPVRTQLALAVASLAAHLPSVEWGGVGALHWLATRLTANGAGSTALPCLLELLTIFPQEAGSYRPALRPDRRRAFAKELILESKAAISFISSCEQHMPNTTRNKRERVLDAYAAWVPLSQGRLGAEDSVVELPQIDPATFASHPLTGLAIESLRLYETNEVEFDHAVDVVCELVRVTVPCDSLVSVDDIGGIPPTSMPLVQLLVPCVMGLRPALATAASSEGVDDDVAKGIARLFAEVGEAYISLITTVRNHFGEIKHATFSSPSIFNIGF